MIVTGPTSWRDEARIYRDQGKGAFGANQHVRLGYAWRMSELHAATGLVHLRRLGEFIASAGARSRRATTPALARPRRPAAAGRARRLRQQLLQVHRAAAARRRPGVVQAGARRAARRPAGRRGVRPAAAPAAGARRVRAGPTPAGRRGRVRAGTSACRSTRTWPTTRSTRCSRPCAKVCGRRAGRPRGARMRVAVTGGCGFIGSHVVDHLVGAGHEVLVVDMQRAVAQPGRASTVIADSVRPRPRSRAAVEGCDAVFHLAGVADVNDVAADPVARGPAERRGHRPGAGRGPARPVRPGRAGQHRLGVRGDRRASGERTEDAPVDLRQVRARVRLDQARRRDARAQLPGDVRPAIHDPSLRHPVRPADAGRARRRAGSSGPRRTASRSRSPATGEQQRNYVYVEDLADAHVLALTPARRGRRRSRWRAARPVSVREIAETVQHLVRPCR